MIRDSWRAVLIVLAVLILRHEDALWQALKRVVAEDPPAVETVAYRPPVAPQTYAPVYGNGYASWQPQQQQQIVVTQQPERPLRRVAAALTEVGDSLIGVVK
ncbi:MAG: hypothetical protein ACO37F_12270 [Pirellulales bacterium]